MVKCQKRTELRLQCENAESILWGERGSVRQLLVKELDKPKLLALSALLESFFQHFQSLESLVM